MNVGCVEYCYIYCICVLDDPGQLNSFIFWQDVASLPCAMVRAHGKEAKSGNLISSLPCAMVRTYGKE